jgi:hypothetical protein
MLATLFLPWYRLTLVQIDHGGASHYRLPLTQVSSGWGAFSLVEALVVAAAATVIVLLFLSAEGRGAELPGGDGGVIIVAGGAASALLVWRMFSKAGLSASSQAASSTGIEWGIFAAVVMAIFLSFTGTRVRRGSGVELVSGETDGTAALAQPRQRAVPVAQPSPAAARAAERAVRRGGAAAATAAGAAGAAELASANEQPSETTADPPPAGAVPPAGVDARLLQAIDTPNASVRDQRPRPSRSDWRPSESPEWSADEAEPPRWLAAAEEIDREHPDDPDRQG